MKKLRFLFATTLLGLAASALAGPAPEFKTSAPSKDENSLNLFSAQTTFTGRSDFRDSRFGSGNSLDEDYSADRRFPVSGNWYFRLGAEYERFDFGGSENGLPNHLQEVYAHVAFEYVVHDHAAAGIELDPGFYFENHIRANAFDMPSKIFVTFPLIKDKVFGVIGVGTSLYQNPTVLPGGGIIWLINDKLRLEGVVPKPALVYNPTEDWELRLLGDFNVSSFRTDDVQTPSSKIRFHNAIVEYSEYRAGGQVNYSGFKPFEIVLGVGYTIQRTFDFYRAERRVSAEGAPYVRVAINAKF